jgi:predicted metal-dependent phosphoesterase TrpH
MPIALAAGLTVLMVAGTIFPTAPLRDAETRTAVTDAHLRLSPAFLAFAPVNNTLDAISLLSLPEHAALLVAIVCAYILWRAWQIRRGDPAAESIPPGEGQAGVRPWLREARYAGVGVLVLFAVYATLALVPRPMAALELAAADSDLVIIDFHSHTSASHDGRRGFSAEKNRAWHRASGFNAAYVTDHYTFEGAEEGMLNNPPQAGERTVLLSGIEVLEGGEHVNVLGVTAADSSLFRGRYLAKDPLENAIAHGRPRPIVVLTIPGPLDHVPRAGMPDVVPVDAIEISDAAPRGLGADDRDHAEVLRLADSLKLALVAGSDNHGWGRTAAAWTLIEIPGWRRLLPDELERRIEERIATGRRRAGRVIERIRPIWPRRNGLNALESGVAAAVDGIRFLLNFIWQLTATRSIAERASWVAWVWVLALIYRRGHA